MIRLLILLYSFRDWIHAVRSGDGYMNLDEARYKNMARGLIEKAVHDAIRIVNVDAKRDGVKVKLQGFALYLDSEQVSPKEVAKDVEFSEFDHQLAYSARIKL